MDTGPTTDLPKRDRHRILSWSLIAILLTLRIPFLGFVGIFTHADWVGATFEVGTYLFTAIFLWWEARNLKEFHVDRLAIWIVVLFKPLETLLLKARDFDVPLAFPRPAAIAIWIIAIALVLALWLRRKDLPRFRWSSLGWFGLGTLIGIGTSILLAWPMSYQAGDGVTPEAFWTILKQMAAWSFFYQIGYAAVSEEPLFRGFLWGAMRKAGWKEVWIWLLQAGLFMLGHVYFFSVYPISLFVIIPVGGLILGLVAWKSRTISATLPLHGAMNTLGLLLGKLAAYYLR
jgi:membrane protease YdiL (CAAX protease family)